MYMWLGAQEGEISKNRPFELNFARFLRVVKQKGHPRQGNSESQSQEMKKKILEWENTRERRTFPGSSLRRWGGGLTRSYVTCGADRPCKPWGGPAQMCKDEGDVVK